MGRRNSIDRDHVLGVAEGIVAAHGAAALSIGAVAAAAGISKGGVQSCFGTKEAMIAAMLARWMDEDDRNFLAAGGDAPDPAARVRAHVETTHRHADAAHAHAVGLLTALLQSPEHLPAVRAWYARRMPAATAGDTAARRARLALLAVEGAVLLRFSGLLPMTQEVWDSIVADIHQLTAGGFERVPRPDDPPTTARGAG